MRRTRRQKRSFRRVKWLAFFLLLLVGIGLVWGFGGLHGRGARGGAPGLMAGEHTVHVMILGVDERADDVGRSDLWAMMLKTFVPLGRAGTGDDIANMVAFLCSDQGAWITGQHIHVDGGHSFTPRR